MFPDGHLAYYSAPSGIRSLKAFAAGHRQRAGLDPRARDQFALHKEFGQQGEADPGHRSLDHRRCCRDLTVKDSHRESIRLNGRHEQVDTRRPDETDGRMIAGFKATRPPLQPHFRNRGQTGRPKARPIR